MEKMTHNTINPINELKIRYDLTPQYGLKEVNRVLTSKLVKYKENQWKKGIKWSEVISNLKRHLAQFELGNDYTDEGLLQIGEVAMNALILSEYYHIFPQGDDRVIAPVDKPIIGCDLDNVIFDFNTAYETKFGIKMNPYWKANYQMNDHLKELEKDKDFWVNLPVLHKPSFEIDYYITARNIPTDWIEESLQLNGLPCAPVLTVPWDSSKVDALKEKNITVMIDDKFENYKEINSAGIFCYLMDAPNNQYYSVGHRRIYDLNIPIK